MGLRGALLAACCACAAVFVAADAATASNPPVIYVHGVSEDACGEQNLKAILDAIRERLPQGSLARPAGESCSGTEAGSNPLRFHYVVDRDSGGDQDVADGGTSQSGVGANARGLRKYIDALTSKGQRKVMLVGFSMGGLVIRRYLAEFHDHADSKVAAVAFVESAHAGSFFATVGEAVASKTATSVCRAQVFTLPSGPVNAALCLGALALARDKFKLEQPAAIAFRDLAPRSEAVRSVATAELPKNPRYLNAVGDIVLRVPAGKIGEWAFGKPYDDLAFGDGVIPPGDSDPRKTPVLGGARFEPRLLGREYSSRQIQLTEICVVGRTEKQKMVDKLIATSADRAAKDPRVKAALFVGRQILGAAQAAGNGLDCVRKTPVAHWNINAHAVDVKPGKIKNLPDVVGDFLVESCKAERLGWCAPEPVLGPGGECGTYTTGRIPNYGPPGGDRRSRDVVLRVDAGQVRCSEGRAALDWYVHAHNPCVNAGNTCVLEHDGWTCSAPSAGSYPAIFRCSRGEPGPSIVAYAAEGLRIGSTKNCGDATDEPPGPFEVKANVPCVTAMSVANSWTNTNDGLVQGFTCKTRPTGFESASTSCLWAGRRIEFVTGA